MSIRARNTDSRTLATRRTPVPCRAHDYWGVNAYELKNVQLMLERAREQLRPGVTGTLAVGQQGVPLDTYIAAWAADPKQVGEDAVLVYRDGNSCVLGGSMPFVNALEGLRDLTGLPIRPVPVNPDEPNYQLLQHSEAVLRLREAGIID
jgi:hypothetical protein